MAEIINLNKARKARARADRAARAAQNRSVFGRTKAEKIRGETQKVTEAVRHDGHRLETPKPE